MNETQNIILSKRRNDYFRGILHTYIHFEKRRGKRKGGMRKKEIKVVVIQVWINNTLPKAS